MIKEIHNSGCVPNDCLYPGAHRDTETHASLVHAHGFDNNSHSNESTVVKINATAAVTADPSA